MSALTDKADGRAHRFSRARLRPLIGRVHLWLGLVIGAFYALAGLTGALLVFYVEADGADPRLRLKPAAPVHAYEAVYQTLRADRPALTGPWRIEAAPPDRAVLARYYRTAAAERRGFAPLVAWTDPNRRAVVREGQWGEYPATWIYDLHYALLLGPLGKLVMAAIGLLSLVLLVGGLWLWWPARGKLKSALTLKPAPSMQRRIYDLHKVAGVYGALQLALVTASGVALGAPAWFRPALALPAPLFAAPSFDRPLVPGERISVDRAVRIAEQRFPTARLRWIETPSTTHGVYRIELAQPWEPSQRFPRTIVWVDARAGEILAVRDPRVDAPGDRVLNWLHPLHNGEAGGLAGRLAALATGLGAVGLFVTGVVRWRHKRRARVLARARRGLASPELAPAQRPTGLAAANMSAKEPLRC